MGRGRQADQMMARVPGAGVGPAAGVSVPKMIL